jgi:hypothetical protein
VLVLSFVDAYCAAHDSKTENEPIVLTASMYFVFSFECYLINLLCFRSLSKPVLERKLALLNCEAVY